MSTVSESNLEAIERFPCFGGSCTVIVQGPGPDEMPPEKAAGRARALLLEWHAQFSRFDRSSELSRLNRDPRASVPVSPMMIRFVGAALNAAGITDGLVDPTLVGALEQAGYGHHFASASLPLTVALRLAPPRRAATPDPSASWRQVTVDRRAGTVTRPPGLSLDSGGIAKGLFGDALAPLLEGHAGFAVEAAGDVRFGGAERLIRQVQVASPFDGGVLHTFELVDGAAATSGIGRRSWLDRHARPAHHLLDPASGRPAFTGLVQVTALAPTATEAEALTKAALLSGPDDAADWLRHGGIVVHESGDHELIAPSCAGGER